MRPTINKTMCYLHAFFSWLRTFMNYLVATCKPFLRICMLCTCMGVCVVCLCVCPWVCMCSVCVCVCALERACPSTHVYNMMHTTNTLTKHSVSQLVLILYEAILSCIYGVITIVRYTIIVLISLCLLVVAIL